MQKLYLYKICYEVKRTLQEYNADPTVSPTLSPTISSEDWEGSVKFALKNNDGIKAEDLMDVMDENRIVLEKNFRDTVEIAIQVLNEENSEKVVDGSSVRRRMRSLEEKSNIVMELNDSSISNFKDFDCSPSNCQSMQGNMNVSFLHSNSNDTTAAQKQLLNKVQTLISNGSLNDSTFTTTPLITPINPPTSSKSLDGGTIAGIATAAAVVGLVAGGFLLSGRNRRNRRNRNTGSQSESKDSHVELAFVNSSDGDHLGVISPYPISNPNSTVGGGSRRKTTPLFTKDDGDWSYSNHDEESSILTPNSHTNRSHRRGRSAGAGDSSMDESSSNAGSSGWSSSAGMSSLNTASVDSMNDQFQFGTSLVNGSPKSKVDGANLTLMLNQLQSMSKDENAKKDEEAILAVTSGDEHSSPSKSSSSDTQARNVVDSLQQISRLDLYNAIEARDWAAVGATAALLAQTDSSHNSSSSYSSAYSSSQLSSTTGGGSSALSSIGDSGDKRADELDKLVDAGDWDGVVLAAAKFEAESDHDFEATSTEEEANNNNLSGYSPRTSRSGESSSSHASTASPVTASSKSGYSPSVSTGRTSESPAIVRKREEIRREVEGLVKRVVPDEIDNVDEMMLQFRGREEELVETLRTMQERSIAKRERETMRRNAKREARKYAKTNKQGNSSIPKSTISPVKAPAPVPVLRSSSTNSDSFRTAMDSMSKLESSTNSDSFKTPTEFAKWEPVGESAISESSVGTSEFDTADEMSEVSSKNSGKVEFNNLPSPNKVRSPLNARKSPKSLSSSSSNNLAKNTSHHRRIHSESSRSFAAGSFELLSVGDSHSSGIDLGQEENDALAQAKKWEAIAAQSKNEASAAAKGASEAADWAISRSLKTLQNSDLFVKVVDQNDGKPTDDSCDLSV